MDTEDKAGAVTTNASAANMSEAGEAKDRSAYLDEEDEDSEEYINLAKEILDYDGDDNLMMGMARELKG